MNQALQDVIEHRRATNVFEPNHTISDEQIEHLVHLATRAPTSVTSEFSLLPDEIPVLLVAIGRAATDNWPQKSRRPLTEVFCFA